MFFKTGGKIWIVKINTDMLLSFLNLRSADLPLPEDSKTQFFNTNEKRHNTFTEANNPTCRISIYI